jgi:perosamine synthetase
MDFLPFALPDITEREKNAVVAALDSNWVTTGPKTKEFEAKFSSAVGGKHGIAMNSCTAALHLGLEAIGVKAGDEVIVPTLTFATSAEVVRYLDAKPVLVDVLPGDHTMDPRAVERALTPETKAIMPVHFAGQACDMDPIMAIARARKLPVIEDAAHSFPTYYKGKIVGSIGDITCFSFYATKTITTGEGGMAVTDHDALAERMRIMSLHGISKDAWKRYTAEGSWYYEIVAPGYKYNLTDIASAMGLVQLDRAQEMLEKRRAIARAYTEAFRDSPAIELLEVRDFDSHAWHLFVIKLRDGVLSIDRNRFIEELKALGIGTSVHFIPLHLHPYYRDTYRYLPEDFPVALDCFKRSISLPVYSKMSIGDVERVIDATLDLVKRFWR